MMLKSIFEPIVVGRKPDEHTRWPTVPRDHDLFARGEAEVFGEVILHLGQCHRSDLAYLLLRAKPALALWG